MTVTKQKAGRHADSPANAGGLSPMELDHLALSARSFQVIKVLVIFLHHGLECALILGDLAS
jgi:hypothetical protein